MVYTGFEYLVEGGLIFSVLLLYLARINNKINIKYIILMGVAVLYSGITFFYVNYNLNDLITNTSIQSLIFNIKIFLESFLSLSIVSYFLGKFYFDEIRDAKFKIFFIVLIELIIILLEVRLNNIDSLTLYSAPNIFNFAVGGFGLLYSFYRTFMYKNGENIKLRAPYIVLNLIILISFLTTVLVYNNSFLFTITVALIIFFVIEEDASKYTNYEFNIFDEKGFLSLFNKKPLENDFVLLMIKLNNSYFVDKDYSDFLSNEIKIAIKKLQKVYGFKNVYYIDQEYLVVKINSFENNNFDIINKQIILTKNQFRDESKIEPTFGKIYFTKGTIIDSYEMYTRIDLFRNAAHGFKKLQIVDFENEIYVNYRREKDVLRAIKTGIENKSFTVVFQPIYDLINDRASGAEALVRLIDPVLGFITPDEFIPIAEKKGLISKIDLFVIEETCKLISKEGRRLKINYIDVNLSRVEAASKSFLNKITDLTEKYNILPKRLHLEITETSDKGQDEAIIDNMSTLSSLGYVFSLDDYGSGYASLDYLTKYNFDIIKIDKTLLKPKSEDPALYSILFNVVNLAKNLHKKIIMEGVETKESVDELKSLGVEFIQGYYFSRPLKEEDYVAFLEKEGL